MTRHLARAGLAVTLAALALASCSTGDLESADGSPSVHRPQTDTKRDSTPPATPSPATAPAEEGGAESAGSSTAIPTSEEPSEEAPPAEPDGSRQDPFLIGTSVGNDEWTVVLGAPHEAWDEIRAENRFNEPPEEGMEHWIVPVTATYTGEETGLAWIDLEFAFVGEDARTYDDCREVIPDDLMDIDELYEGGVAEGNVCITVPAGADGLWTVSDRWSDPTFFAAE